MDFPDADLSIHKRRPRRLTITVPLPVYARLCELSQRQGRSISNLAAYLLEIYARKNQGGLSRCLQDASPKPLNC